MQVRDNLFGGSDTAVYRIRVTSELFATGQFPLGGTAGSVVLVTASGGNLATPLSQQIALANHPGERVDVPPFDGPGGTVSAPAPGRLVVGEGLEPIENPSETAGTGQALESGATLNARLDRPGEVDRYRLAVSKGKPLRLTIRASSLGSWLDSVLRVRDASGRVLAENDDASGVLRAGRAAAGMRDAANLDSRLDLVPPTEGSVTVEVFDRFSRGGPEFSYRLIAGPPPLDFEVSDESRSSGFRPWPGKGVVGPDHRNVPSGTRNGLHRATRTCPRRPARAC